MALRVRWMAVDEAVDEAEFQKSWAYEFVIPAHVILREMPPVEADPVSAAEAEATAALAYHRGEPVPEWAREQLAAETARLVGRALHG